MKAKMIVFEGMDCSFKETNSKRLYQYLKEDLKKEKVYLLSFPNYNSPSSYFVRNILSGKYSKEFSKENLCTLKSMAYALDRADTICNITRAGTITENEPGSNGIFTVYDEMGNMINNNIFEDEEAIIICDRYTISNIFYQSSDFIDMPSYYRERLCCEIANYDLSIGNPVENLCIILESPLEKIKEVLSVKKNKDINEQNFDFITNVYHNLQFCKKHGTLNHKDRNIQCLSTVNDDNEFYTEDELFERVLFVINQYINLEEI